MRLNGVLLRLVAEAVAIVAAAVIAGPILHLAWWQVGLTVFLVLGAGIVVESLIEGREAQPAPRPAPPRVEEPPPSYVRVLSEQKPEPTPPPEPEPAPEPEPVAVAVAAPPVRVTGPPWNLWELERAFQASGEGDEEKSFMLQYLRDYAGTDGVLPPEFDDLVRESFGSLL
jgi:hypothetical protein